MADRKDYQFLFYIYEIMRVNIEKLHQIAKPRNKREYLKSWFRHKFRGIVILFQNIQLWVITHV